MAKLIGFPDKTLYRFQISAECFSVYVIPEALQIDIQCIHIRKNRICCFFADTSVGNQHHALLLFAQEPGRIHNVFIRDQRFIVRKSYSDIPSACELFRHICQAFRGDLVFPVFPIRLIFAAVGHGDLPVLAEGTAQVAAVAAVR